MVTETVKTLHRELRGNYASSWNADRDALLKRVLPEMLGEIGEVRTSAAVRACMKTEPFFTEEALRRHIPTRESEAKRCAVCQDTDGWRYKIAETVLSGNGYDSRPCNSHLRVTRCLHDGTPHDRLERA